MTPARRTPRHQAFTLIEVLAVVLMTAIVLGVALDFYVELSSKSARASEHTREVRRAVAILDRVATDFEHALLARKPEELDPLSHPWVFVAESHYSTGGADRVKFPLRQTARSSAATAGDVGMVAYVLRPDEEAGGYALRRWTAPQLPEGLDRDFPDAGASDALLLAGGIERFALRFLNEAGAWVEEWDSSLIVDSSELPLAVEIELALREPERQAEPFGAEPVLYTRRVQLPVRPLDFEVLLDPETYADSGSGEEGDEDCLTIAECVDFSRLGGNVDAQTLEGLGSLDQNECFEAVRPLLMAQFPSAVDPSCR